MGQNLKKGKSVEVDTKGIYVKAHLHPIGAGRTKHRSKVDIKSSSWRDDPLHKSTLISPDIVGVRTSSPICGQARKARDRSLRSTLRGVRLSRNRFRLVIETPSTSDLARTSLSLVRVITCVCISSTVRWLDVVPIMTRNDKAGDSMYASTSHERGLDSIFRGPYTTTMHGRLTYISHHGRASFGIVAQISVPAWSTEVGSAFCFVRPTCWSTATIVSCIVSL
nr:hypothetical protein CFP56_00508 [Quercus suber]